jgi:Na+:H+ antiporter, NhaA family
MTSVNESLATRSLPPALRRFLATEVAGGIVLAVAALAALVWANSPWRSSYDSLWHADVVLRVGTIGVAEDLRHLVNDGLMAVFFLVVGLEVKRELVTGDLRDPRVAALPAIAAAGGMLVPAAIFAAVNAGGAGSHGWGIPMATDIAFALGVVALLGPRVPPSLKVFLLSLAIVDDIGAIVVIAVFYARDLAFDALALAATFALAAVVLRMLRVRWTTVYLALGVACWLATYESGVHATIAGVVFGLLMPARPLAPAHVAARWASDLSDEPTPEEVRDLVSIANETVSTAERLEHQLHPFSSLVIVPLFALANAGVEIRRDAFDAPGAKAIAAGVVLGLVVGKLVGIFGAAWLAVRSRVVTLPPETTWPMLAGVAAIAGIGFTVSLFVSGLAFDQPALDAAAKLAILVASVIASLVGAAIILRVAPVARRDDPPT